MTRLCPNLLALAAVLAACAPSRPKPATLRALHIPDPRMANVYGLFNRETRHLGLTVSAPKRGGVRTIRREDDVSEVVARLSDMLWLRRRLPVASGPDVATFSFRVRNAAGRERTVVARYDAGGPSDYAKVVRSVVADVMRTPMGKPVRWTPAWKIHAP